MQAHTAVQLLHRMSGIVAGIDRAGDAQEAAARPKKRTGIPELPAPPHRVHVDQVQEAGQARHHAQRPGPSLQAPQARHMLRRSRDAPPCAPQGAPPVWPARTLTTCPARRRPTTRGGKAPASRRPRSQTAPPRRWRLFGVRHDAVSRPFGHVEHRRPRGHDTKKSLKRCFD